MHSSNDAKSVQLLNRQIDYSCDQNQQTHPQTHDSQDKYILVLFVTTVPCVIDSGSEWQPPTDASQVHTNLTGFIRKQSLSRNTQEHELQQHNRVDSWCTSVHRCDIYDHSTPGVEIRTIF